jgi:four helix bundle protein
VAKAKRFEELWIWQEARSFVKSVYVDTKNNKCASDFGFRDQIQKAAISIMNNIAEGFERSSDADFARFLDIAKGSCGEVRSMCYTAEDLCYVDHDTAMERREKAAVISAGIKSLSNHLRKDA